MTKNVIVLGLSYIKKVKEMIHWKYEFKLMMVIGHFHEKAECRYSMVINN